MNGSGKALFTTLRTQIENGDTEAEIVALLGQSDTSLLNTEGRRAKRRLSIAELAARKPEFYPMGYEETDGFLFYTGSRWTRRESVDLQFREGRLINHNPDLFEKFRPRLVTLGPGL